MLFPTEDEYIEASREPGAIGSAGGSRTWRSSGTAHIMLPAARTPTPCWPVCQPCAQWFTKAGFTDVKITRIGPKWCA
jgi:hypothetical protein